MLYLTRNYFGKIYQFINLETNFNRQFVMRKFADLKKKFLNDY